MKLTKRRSLIWTRDLWDWLAKSGESVKSCWPKWERNGGTIPRLLHYCPCCEYAGEAALGKMNCFECPLKSFWPRKQAGDDDGVFCQREKSAYQLWRFASGSDERKKHAARIANAARAELAKMS